MSHLQNLPVSLITSIVSYLPPVDIDKIPQLSKWFHQTIFQDEQFWRILCKEIDPVVYGKIDTKNALTTNWKSFYHKLTGWRFDIADKPAVLVLSEDNTLVTRPEDVDINPSVRTTLPFSKQRNFYQVEVLSIGSWIRIGIADKRLKMSGSSLLGEQSDSPNMGCSGLGGISIWSFVGKVTSHVTSPVFRPPALVGFMIDKDIVYIYKDGRATGKFKLEAEYLSVELYPTVSISYNSKVKLRSLTFKDPVIEESLGGIPLIENKIKK